MSLKALIRSRISPLVFFASSLKPKSPVEIFVTPWWSMESSRVIRIVFTSTTSVKTSHATVKTTSIEFFVAFEMSDVEAPESQTCTEPIILSSPSTFAFIIAVE